jgi:GR25 family glycosyltransferase involved in LPS biosynthesis
MIPVYWINLDESVDRRNIMVDQLLSQGVINKRIAAIKHEKPLIGCCLSHIKAIHTAWIEGNQLALICEDDIDFSNAHTIYKRLQILLESMPTTVQNDWDVLQIQYTEPQFSKGINNYIKEYIKNNGNTNNLENRLVKNYLYGCVGYLINRRGMYNFLKRMTVLNTDDMYAYNVTATFDHPRAHSEELVYRYLNTYMSVFPILNYADSISTINSAGDYIVKHDFNRINTNNNRTTLTDINYRLINSDRIYELEYDLHWFNGGKEEVESVLTDIFGGI